MGSSRKLISYLIIFFSFLATFNQGHAINHQDSNQSNLVNYFPLKNIDITPKKDIQKIKKTRGYPLTYKEAVNLLEMNVLRNQSPSSLFQYTLLSEESKGDGELSPNQIIKIMINYLKKSTIRLNQKELDRQAWPSHNSKTHLLFILNYDMDGFVALVKFIVDRKLGTVSLEEIAD